MIDSSVSADPPNWDRLMSTIRCERRQSDSASVTACCEFVLVPLSVAKTNRVDRKAAAFCVAIAGRAEVDVAGCPEPPDSRTTGAGQGTASVSDQRRVSSTVCGRSTDGNWSSVRLLVMSASIKLVNEVNLASRLSMWCSVIASSVDRQLGLPNSSCP